eukprot:554032-Amorphochlora_amoeboformis.AAC.1
MRSLVSSSYPTGFCSNNLHPDNREAEPWPSTIRVENLNASWRELGGLLRAISVGGSQCRVRMLSFQATGFDDVCAGALADLCGYPKCKH